MLVLGRARKPQRWPRKWLLELELMHRNIDLLIDNTCNGNP